MAAIAAKRCKNLEFKVPGQFGCWRSLIGEAALAANFIMSYKLCLAWKGCAGSRLIGKFPVGRRRMNRSHRLLRRWKCSASLGLAVHAFSAGWYQNLPECPACQTMAVDEARSYMCTGYCRTFCDFWVIALWKVPECNSMDSFTPI